MSPTPLVFERADGAYLFDADGNRLIDYYLGMGPMILGHTPADVRAAVVAQLEKGILYGGQSAVTGRRTIIKFAGHYHGWFDNILWSTAPPADAAAPVPGSRGQQQTTEDVVVLEWNDLPLLRTRLAKGDIAAVIM